MRRFALSLAALGLLALSGCAEDPTATEDQLPLESTTLTVYTDGGCYSCRGGDVQARMTLRVALASSTARMVDITTAEVTLRREGVEPIALPPGSSRSRELVPGEEMGITWGYGYPAIDEDDYGAAWVIDLEVEVVDVETGERTRISLQSETFSFGLHATG